MVEIEAKYDEPIRIKINGIEVSMKQYKWWLRHNGYEDSVVEYMEVEKGA